MWKATLDEQRRSGRHCFPTAEAAKAHATVWQAALPALLTHAAEVRRARQSLDANRAAYGAIIMDNMRRKGPPLVDAAKAAELRVLLAEKQLVAKQLALKTIAAPLEEERGVPVVNEFKLEDRMENTPFSTSAGDDGIVVRGTEYLGSSTISGTQPAGAPVFSAPVSPSALGGGRLAAFATLYDLFKIRKLVFEFTSMEGSNTGGAVGGAVINDIFEEPSLTVNGDAAIRDLLERPGASVVQLFGNCAFGVNYPQQQVFFTSNTDAPNLSYAGLFELLQVNAIAASTLGLVCVHYELEFLADSSVRSTAATVVVSPNITANFTGLTLTAQQQFFTNSMSGGSALAKGQVAVGVVSTMALGGAPANMWNLVTGEAHYALTLAVGMRIYWRLDAAGTNYLFYPSFGAAVVGHDSATDAGSSADTLVNTVTNAIGASTPSVVFEQVRFYTLPESTK